MKRARHAVVVGGGLGGLAASLRLAHQGWHVTLCERNATVGGKMNRWASQGFVFDTGPSVITLPWVFEELFQDLGFQLNEHVRLRRLDTLARYDYADGMRFTYSAHDAIWYDELRRIAPSDEQGFRRFMRLGQHLYALSLDTFLRRPVFGRVSRRMLSALRHFPVRGGWNCYASTVASHFNSPHLRQLFNRYPTYVGSSPFETPATFALIPYMERHEGAWHVDGGLYRIVEGLVALSGQLDVDIVTSAEVSRIRRDGNRAIGVELVDGTRIDSDIVVMNADVSNTRRLLGFDDTIKTPAEHRSMSGFVLLLGIGETLPAWSHHNVFFSADYRHEFHQIFHDRCFPDDPTVYVCIPSRTDRALVPGNGETLFVMANAPATDRPWTEREIADAKARVLGRLRRSGMLPHGVQTKTEKVLPPCHFAARYAAPGGAIYGQDSHGWRRAFFRPPNRDRTVPGLYHVGGSVHPGGGTPTVLMSAKITADEIHRFED